MSLRHEPLVHLIAFGAELSHEQLASLGRLGRLAMDPELGKAWVVNNDTQQTRRRGGHTTTFGPALSFDLEGIGTIGGSRSQGAAFGGAPIDWSREPHIYVLVDGADPLDLAVIANKLKPCGNWQIRSFFITMKGGVAKALWYDWYELSIIAELLPQSLPPDHNPRPVIPT